MAWPGVARVTRVVEPVGVGRPGAGTPGPGFRDRHRVLHSPGLSVLGAVTATLAQGSKQPEPRFHDDFIEIGRIAQIR